jgi:hypothetical protein
MNALLDRHVVRLQDAVEVRTESVAASPPRIAMVPVRPNRYGAADTQCETPCP